jgi:hypothetical protein
METNKMKSETVPIAITMSDGTLTIMHFVTRECNPDGSVRWAKPPTKENVQAEVDKVFGNPAITHAVSWRQITYDDVPPDRTYRNAWRDDGKHIYHDMDHVRTLHLENLRYARAPLLEEKDRSWMRATGQGRKEDAAEIEMQRQELRDLPAAIAKALGKAKTPEEVKKIGIDKLR